MPPFRGRILVYNNPRTNSVQVIAENRGESPGLMTHNMFKTEMEANQHAYQNGQWVQHDDNGQFGHGTPVGPGTFERPQKAAINMNLGNVYNAGYGRHPVRIEPGAFLRVGFRNRAWQVVEVPKAGEVKVVPYDTLRPIRPGDSPMAPQGWVAEAVPANAPVAVDDPGLAEALRKLNAPVELENPHLVDGRARIVPLEDPARPGQLAGWDIWFENQGKVAEQGQTTGFTGTVVLTDAAGNGSKNDGLGLESMACPAGGCAARQRIRFEGDYGKKPGDIVARPGVPIRLGIRGWATQETVLPELARGEVQHPIAKFKKEADASNSEWFDDAALLAKLGEKKGRVDFYRADKRINDELPDTIYAGQDAFDRADFKSPPRVTIRWNARQRGWDVDAASLLPAADAKGPIAYPVTIKRAAAGPPLALPDGHFAGPGQAQHWFIPANWGLAVGHSVRIETGPLGWEAELPLPNVGGAVDSEAPQQKLAVWKLRETRVNRAELFPPAVPPAPQEAGPAEGPQVHHGAEAVKRSTFPVPEIHVRYVEKGVGDVPGWTVEIRNRLGDAFAANAPGVFPPAFTDAALRGRPLAGQPMGFVATLRLGDEGQDKQNMYPKLLAGNGTTRRWFIPRGARAESPRGVVPAEPGAALTIGTRGMGVYARFPLPEAGQEVVVSPEKPELYSFRPDQLEPGNLTRAFARALKDVPDPPGLPAP